MNHPWRGVHCKGFGLSLSEVDCLGLKACEYTSQLVICMCMGSAEVWGVPVSPDSKYHYAQISPDSLDKCVSQVSFLKVLLNHEDALEA